MRAAACEALFAVVAVSLSRTRDGDALRSPLDRQNWTCDTPPLRINEVPGEDVFPFSS
jgi:hypothetical protein